MNDPQWKVALNWGAVITFFALPLIFLAIHLVASLNGIRLSKDDFGYLKDLQRNVTILVASLAGLKTWEQVRNGKQQPTNDSHDQTYK